ncbi:hypothetical protein GCM10011450_25520 [Advenella faeciporci]|uniref:Ribbon-helix-helix domain-containing protein n=1 Tax=Advenella faeciporci TaxID=797535 RepID=A0A918MZU4_9BURK|nr:ribbon-helix-helix domain-containing protein [Advenella faeciporci]NLY33591.1 aryl-sulfate sulfotransferase [Alcaligenaceae bacterium]GGW94530.1 hypothetical protein GCM10011450_25520 [Advenella faeciporci]
MCSIYSQTDPIMYESRSRSVRIARVVTSIRLENMFWETLAENDGVTTNQLIAQLYDEVYAYRGEATNFTSFLRVTCMRYQAVRHIAGKAERFLNEMKLMAGKAPVLPARQVREKVAVAR